jgi:pilus assembly protein CpaE
MSGTLRVAICDPNETSRETIKKSLIGMDRVWMEADSSRYELFPEIVEQANPDVAIIDIDGDEEKALALVEQISKAHSSCGVVVISSMADGQLILRAMRAGAREFLNSPVKIEELVGALDRVAAAGGGDNRSKSGQIITFAGASGGVGTTSIAVNTAVSMAQNPEFSVALVDLDLALGDADVFLDMIPEYTLLDVTQNISRLDLALLRKSLTKHESGVYLLPRPVQIEDLATISEENFRRVLGLLKASFSHVIVDLSKTYNRLDIAALESSDTVVLLTQLDLPCLRNVVRLFSAFEAFEGVSNKVKVVVNRSGLDKTQISADKAEETIDREIYARVPNNYFVISECRNNGVPLITQAPKAAVTVAIQELAHKLAGSEPEQSENGDDKSKKSWLNFLSKSEK